MPSTARIATLREGSKSCINLLDIGIDPLPALGAGRVAKQGIVVSLSLASWKVSNIHEMVAFRSFGPEFQPSNRWVEEEDPTGGGLSRSRACL
jgi:hypothetical protein